MPEGTAPGRPLGAVLAGGRGSRLGGAKAAAELAGMPLAAHPLAALREAGVEAVVYAKPGQVLPDLGVPVRREPASPRHPLCGIVAALRDCREEARPLVVLACDLPFVPAPLVAALAAAPEPLVAVAGERVQPLLARYDPVLLPALEASLLAREPLTRTVLALGPRLIAGEELRRFGDPDRILFNVNDDDDLRRAAEL